MVLKKCVDLEGGGFFWGRGQYIQEAVNVPSHKNEWQTLVGGSPLLLYRKTFKYC